MKKIYILFTTSIIFGLTSCGNYLDKPITKELTEKELNNSLIELNSDLLIDSTLYSFHNGLKLIRDTLKLDINLKEKFNSLTYRDYYEYTRLRNDNSFFDSLSQNVFKPKYESKYGRLKEKIDSLYESYYINPIKLEDYVKVELGDVDTEYYYSGGISDVSLGFKLTPLKGTIQQIVFQYKYKPKIGGKEYTHRCRRTKPFSRRVGSYWEVDYSERNILGGETPSTIKRDYDFDIKILKIRYNNENLSNDDMDIPFEIRMRKKYTEEGDQSMVEYYTKDISEEYLNQKYISYKEFLEPKKDSVIKSLTPKYNTINDLFDLEVVFLLRSFKKN